MKLDFYLASLNSKEKLKEHFIENWNWENPEIEKTFFSFPDDINSKIIESFELACKLDFKVIYFSLKNVENPEKKLKTIEKKIINFLKSQINLDDIVFIFSYNNFDYLDFIRAEKIATRIKIKRFFISPENRDKLRTASEQLQNLKLNPSKISRSYISECIENAFSVEIITDKFYEEYTDVFDKIKKYLKKQKIEEIEDKEKKLIDFVHQILNRIMFLYFVQKRGCFGGDKAFLANYWDAYKSKYNGENKFHSDWLNVLFFEALSQPSWLYKEKKYLENFNKILKDAPYLNGGLFEKNDLDKIGWEIPDEHFEDIFEFFESYNFTIEESTPFELDIAINPEMLGNIYEHIVNIEEKTEQSKAGIFYTERVEIELMLGRALAEFLYNKTKIPKTKIYQFIFQEIEEQIENPFSKEEAQKMLEELENILILDPACGSGHYLVVAAQVLYKLKSILWDFLKKARLGAYEEKKKIIERNIYGNDIKLWATNIAKLRLWLDLFVDADLDILKSQAEPLLPNLNFKIRCGDSLVQRIGKELIPLRRIGNFLKSRKEDLKDLIKRKKYVYTSGSARDYEATILLEKKLLQNAISDMIIKIKKEIQSQKALIGKNQGQEEMFSLKKEKGQEKLSEKEFKEKLEELNNDLKQFEKIQEEISNLKEPPMIWDLSFAEVFGMKKGFDIVIANPPYVRQEKIEDLNGFYSKEEYKEKLLHQLQKDYSIDYEGNFIRKGEKIIDLSKKCDLYVHFYFKGLKLLNPDGILCYISSNSWLDVGFGSKMQEILLKNFPIISIYDNLVKRSFKRADVNTIIAIIGAEGKDVSQNCVNFIMFKRPFEEIMYSDIFIDLEKEEGFKKLLEGERRENDIFRIHKLKQSELYEIGKDKKTGEYEGNKWGGKYLLSPIIFWKIITNKNLIQLKDLKNIYIKRGIKTGADKFFIVNKTIIDNFKIEKEYYFNFKILESVNDCKNIDINPEKIEKYLINVNDPKKFLKKNILKYILYGEQKSYCKNKSLKNRKLWYSINLKEKPQILFPLRIRKNFIIYLSNGVYGDHSIAEIFFSNYSYDEIIKIALLLNASLTLFFVELFGRGYGGGGGPNELTIDELKSLYIVNINRIDKKHFNIKERKIGNIFKELGFTEKLPIRQQEPNPLPDRKALDDIVFDALGLTEEERKEVYWAVAELVQNRLKKAKSV